MASNEKRPVLHGAEEAARYFKYMGEFVGFTQADRDAIRQSGLIVEKHLPDIIANFYTNLLQYPPTRKFFLKKDGTVNNEYLQLRMLHQANFWRRAAGGEYDGDFAGFVDYVGRAHTSRGADPRLFIDERYVIGMVGFMQHAIIDSLITELHEYDEDLEKRAIIAWNKLCMVILEMLARAYMDEHTPEPFEKHIAVDPGPIFQMSVDSYERSLGMHQFGEVEEIIVGRVEEIPEGERKIVQINGLSIGVFHHNGNWYALRNHCLHRGGPVATGTLDGDHLICPWHGYTYDVKDGTLLMDPSAKLDMYAVLLVDGEIHLQISKNELVFDATLDGTDSAPVKDLPAAAGLALKENELLLNELLPGKAKRVHLDGRGVAVYNVDGNIYATQDDCTHAGGSLSEGELEGEVITCPLHFSSFNVTSGAVICRPATEALKIYRVEIEGEILRVMK